MIGKCSSDRDGTIASYTWRENGTLVADGVTATLDLLKGDYVFELTVTDNDGLTRADTVAVAITKESGGSGGGGSCNPNRPNC